MRVIHGGADVRRRGAELQTGHVTGEIYGGVPPPVEWPAGRRALTGNITAKPATAQGFPNFRGVSGASAGPEISEGWCDLCAVGACCYLLWEACRQTFRPRVLWTWRSSDSDRHAGMFRSRFGNGPPRVTALVVAECFSRAIGLPVVGVFGARWSGGSAGWVRCLSQVELWLAGLRAARLYRELGAVRAGYGALAVGSRVLRRPGGRILGIGFGSSLRSSQGCLSLFLGHESVPDTDIHDCGGKP